MTGRERSVVDYMRNAAKEAMREQIAFAEVPSPTWRAGERAAYFADRLAAEGLSPSRDAMGNIVAKRSGTARRKRPTLILDAHLDSVFYDVNEIKVRREGRRYHGPGIGDDAAGIANLIILARALGKFDLRTTGDIVFLGSVGEESEGQLKGIRHFWKNANFAKPYFISIDSGTTRITDRALASWSPKIVVKGPGGHSYGHFGRPNPVHMLSRFVSKLTTLRIHSENRSTYNATIASGGTALNVIPCEARLAANLRSAREPELEAMIKDAKRFLREARREELQWATRDRWLDVRYTALKRPGGATAKDHPLVAAVSACYEAEDIKPTYGVGSTNANILMSLGIPAIAIGAGGRGGNVHALDEWFENSGRGKALAALARVVVEIAG